MLPFKDALNNDNPVSDELNLESLNVWYCALPLVLSNLFGAPLAVYCHVHALFLLAIADFVAIVLSMLYHTCQTTHVCFGISLSTWTLADHISAPMYMMALILFLINTRSSKQRRVDARRRYHHHFGHRNTVVSFAYGTAASLVDDELDDIDELEASKTYYHVGYSHVESNDENNAWGVYTMYSSIFIVILAALAHNFSLQAFIIAFTYGLGVIFFKVVVIDEGDAINMYERVSLPDLIIGVSLLLFSLIFYMLDIYVAYTVTHSLWHVLSFIGSYFLTIGLTRHIDHWYSPTLYCYHRIARKCCHRSTPSKKKATINNKLNF